MRFEFDDILRRVPACTLHDLGEDVAQDPSLASGTVVLVVSRLPNLFVTQMLLLRNTAYAIGSPPPGAVPPDWYLMA